MQPYRKTAVFCSTAARAVAAASITFVGVVWCAYGVGVRVVVTPSAPRGVYRVVSGDLTRDSLIVFCLPSSLASLGRTRGYLPHGHCEGQVLPLLKPVVGLPGDIVEVSEQGIRVNGVRYSGSSRAETDTPGRTLPAIAAGRYLVHAGEVWVLSTYAPNSWDSRYYGPVNVEQVLGVAHPLWVWR